MKNDFVSKGTSVSDLKLHLVLTTKYRRKAITGEMLERLHVVLAELLAKWDCKLIEFNGTRTGTCVVSVPPRSAMPAL